MSHLEKYIIEHRDTFDSDIPTPKAWANIERSLEEKAFVGEYRTDFDNEIPPAQLWENIALTQFISQTREAFDSETPNEKIWQDIEQRLGNKKEETPIKTLNINWLRSVRVAASVILLVGVGAMLGIWYSKPAKLAQLAANRTTLSEISPEYAELEQFYSRKVNARLQDLDNANLDSRVQPNLAELDAIYLELQHEFDNAPQSSRAQIVQAMIKNYQTKVAVLERVLQQHEAYQRQQNAPDISQPKKQLSL